MKLIKQFESLTDAKFEASKFEDKGILTHVSSAKSAALSRFQTGALKVGLWVVLEEQYEDAFALIKNKRHKVANALTPEQIASYKSNSQVNSFPSIAKFMAFALIGLLCLTLTIVYLAN